MLAVRRVAGDGHCLFRAYLVSLGRVADDAAVAAARARVVAHVRAQWAEYAPFARGDHASADVYERDMGASGAAWGGELELAALARVDGARIRVYDARRRRWMPEYAPVAAAAGGAPPLATGQAQPVARLRHRVNHYDAICTVVPAAA